MPIFKVGIEASVGAVYVRAEDRADALRKLDVAKYPNDTQDVRYDLWDPELFDLDEDALYPLDQEQETIAEAQLFNYDPESLGDTDEED